MTDDLFGEVDNILDTVMGKLETTQISEVYKTKQMKAYKTMRQWINDVRGEYVRTSSNVAVFNERIYPTARKGYGADKWRPEIESLLKAQKNPTEASFAAFDTLPAEVKAELNRQGYKLVREGKKEFTDFEINCVVINKVGND